MNTWPMHALVLIVFLAWTTQIIAEDDDNNMGNAKLHILKSPIEVDRATFRKKLHWAVMSLINPDDRYKLVPLFGYTKSHIGYTKSDIKDNLNGLLVEATAGNVRLAIVSPRRSESGNIDYEGQGLVVLETLAHVNAGSVPVQWVDENIDSLYQRLQEQDILLALTRPLRDIEPKEEFVAGLDLWANESNAPPVAAVASASTGGDTSIASQ